MDNKEPEKMSNEEIENMIIAECTVKDRTFAITSDKRIFEKSKDGNYKECMEDDEETTFLRKYTQPPKSLDIER